MSRLEVSVVIVTYNSAHVIGDCLINLGNNNEVIVYDNASVDGTVSLIRERFPSVRVIAGTENLGFAKAVNKAAATATGSKIMLLNPDAVIRDDAIRILTEALPITHGGVVAPLISHPTGIVRVASAGYMPTAWRMFTHYFGVSRLAAGHDWLAGHYLLPSQIGTAPFEVEWVTGACLMVDAEIWQRLGGLSERWFMYAEDLEFCWRVSQSGGAVLVQSAARAQHLVGSSDGKRGPETNSSWVVNLYDFYAIELAHNRLQRVWWGVVVGIGLLLRSGVFLVQSYADRHNSFAHRNSAREFLLHARAVSWEAKREAYGRRKT